MKKIIIIIGLLILGTQALWATITVDGNAYLENQTDHSGIEIFLERTAPSSLTYTVYTDTSGYYTADIETGIYDITYSKDDYFNEWLTEQTLYSNTTIPDITLMEHTTILNVPAQFSSIQTAIDYAWDGDTVLVDTGRYYENINFNGKNITVASLFFTTQDTFYITQTIINGDSVSHVVTFNSNEDSTAVLCGFIITNGYAEDGGGIYCYCSSPTLGNVIITGNNSADDGGGIYCYYSSPSLENVTITNNTALGTGSYNGGGGIYCSNSSPSLDNVIISGNSAYKRGGGMLCYWDSSPSLENVTITDNSAHHGGGIYCISSSPSLENVTIISNSAFDGGGIYYSGSSSLSLENVTITDNSAGLGGGIYYSNNSSSASLENVTITGNSSSSGGGIYCYYSSPTLGNVIITNNSAGNGGGIYCFESSPILENITISGNSADYGGGGICCYNNSYPIFSGENRCNIYSNYITSNRGAGTDIIAWNCGIINVILDTFSVITPTDYYASPIDSLNFDILHSIQDSLINSDVYVAVDGDDSNSGIYPGEPFRTIKYALSRIYSDSLNNNTIHLASGVYSDSTNGETFPLKWSSYVNLSGSGEGESILDANEASRVIEFRYVIEALIKDITITNGFSASEGGGIHCYSSSPSLENVTITDNSASGGGGISCYGSSLSLENVTITDNSSSSGGGGISCGPNSSMNLKNVTITGNSGSNVSDGGGINCSGSSMSLENVTITDNSCGIGGGIHCGGSSMSLENVTITGNSANKGGGIYCSSSSPSLENVTITGNSANYDGGGIICYSSSPSIVNTIVSDNNGNYGIYVYSGNPTITYSNFWNNEYGNFYGVNDSIGVNVTTNANGDSCDVYCNIQFDPLFVDPANGDYHLIEDSPCVDAGDPSSTLDPDGTVADMGAFFYDQNHPSADFTANITNGIYPLIIDFSDLSIMGLSGNPIIEWFWDFNNDGTIDSYEQNPQWTYTEVGLYTVTLTVGDGSYTDSETKVDYITVLEPIDADFEAVPLLGLAPLDVQFTDLSTGGLQTLLRESKKSNNLKIVKNDNSRDIVSWEWDFDNDGTIDSYLQNPYYTYSEVGVYTVSLKVSDGTNEDTEIKADYITVGEPIIADFEAVPLLGLAPLDVQFTDLSTGGLDALPDYVMCTNRQTKERSENMMYQNNSREITTWEWDFNNDGTIDSYEQNPQWTYNEAGLYTVSLTVSDGSNTGNETKVDYITVGEPIVADFEADPTLGSLPLYVQFTDLSTGGLETLVTENKKINNSKVIENDNSRDIVSWEWDFDNNGVIDSYEQNPTHIYDYVGYYSVSLTVTDNNNNYDTLTKEDYIFVNPDIEFSYQTDGVIESGISLLSEDVLYCAASGDCVYRFNNNGQIEYTLNVNGDIKSATTITPDHNVYIASTDYNLYSFNSNGVSNTGWPLSLGAEATASVASDSVGNIYIGTQNGIFQVVDPDGENIWSYNVGAPVHSSAVISFDNTLYVINTNGRLYAFDLNTIDPQNVVYKWRIETNGAVSSTPALDDINNIYIANENGQLTKINDDGINGNVVWTFESGSTIIESSPLIDINYNVYFGCSNGRVYSVNDSGQLNWMSDEFGPIKSTGALFESDETQSRIYIGSNNGKLYALSTEDGTILWQYTADSAIVCPILYNAGKIYFGTVNGEILVINDPDISTGTIFRDTSIWSTFQGNNLRTGNQTDNMVAVDPENINNISYLMQNYPNPINSNTNELKVSFIMKQRGNVTIQLFNIKGQLVSILINEDKIVGEYTITYPINELSSGIYFIRMSVDRVDKEIRKVVLLR